MARYDLSKIMKKAWALFTNARAKYPTFADALRKSWKTAKWEKSIAEKCKAIEEEEKVHEEKAREKREQADRIRREAEAKAERMKAEIAARKEGISYNEYQDRISRAMGYGCGLYCGD